MARPFPSNSVQPQGELTVQKVETGFYRALYTPPAKALTRQRDNPENYTRPIFEIIQTKRVLTVYPYQVWGMHPMSAKYKKLICINLELQAYYDHFIPDSENIDDFLAEVLPTVFTEDYNYGLGFRKSYKYIITLLEEFDVEVLTLTSTGATSFNKHSKEVILKYSDLDILRRNIDSIDHKAHRVAVSFKKEALNELLTTMLLGEKNKVSLQSLSREISEKLTNPFHSAIDLSSKKKQKEVIDIIRKNNKRILTDQPDELFKLRNEIELVSMEQLIIKFEYMLGKHLSESHWQTLFDHNPFILNMAFSIPVIKVKEQTSLNGIAFSGKGNKIADFLVKNGISNNAAIIEIKTPSTKLMNSKEYRQNLYAPSVDLTGAVNQILDQIFTFQKEINSLKVNSKEYLLESYSVSGILIAGISPANDNEKKSFEFFRGNSKSVQIITFDELLRKLKDLYNFLKPRDADSETSSLTNGFTDGFEDMPF